MRTARQRWTWFRWWVIPSLAFALVVASYVHKTTRGTWQGPTNRFTPGYEAAFDYYVLADAFRAKQVSLLYEPDPELLKLPNPYDPDARARAGVQFAWDNSLYKGKYYLYFTPVPVLLFYLPYWAIFGAYPDRGFVLDLELAITALFLCLTIQAIYRGITLRMPVVAAALTLAIGFAHGGRATLDNPTWYTLACASSSMWVSIALFASASVFYRRATVSMAALAGAACVLALWSRPHTGCVLLVPLVAAWAMRKRFKLNKKALLAAFAVPYLLGAGLIGTYNYLRFENPLQFGQAYILTVLDATKTVSRYKDPFLMFQRERVALPVILFRMPAMDPETGNWVPKTEGEIPLPPDERLFQDPTVGILVICPMLVVGLLVFAPRIWRRMKRRSQILFSLTTLVCAGITTLFLGNMNCVAARYNLDILPLALVAVIVLALEFQRGLSPKFQHAISGTLIALSAVSVAINLQF